MHLEKILLILSNPLVKISGEKTSVSGNLFCSSRTLHDSTVVHKNRRAHQQFAGARVSIYKSLFKHARVRMLRNEALAQQLESFSVISDTIEGLFRNHQQPNGIRLLKFLAVTHNSCWFSRERNVARNLT